MEKTLHQLLGLKEALEVTHLPDACEDENDGLSDGPPQDPLVGALTGQTKALFTILRGTTNPGLQGQENPVLATRTASLLWNYPTKCLRYGLIPPLVPQGSDVQQPSHQHLCWDGNPAPTISSKIPR